MKLGAQFVGALLALACSVTPAPTQSPAQRPALRARAEPRFELPPPVPAPAQLQAAMREVLESDGPRLAPSETGPIEPLAPIVRPGLIEQPSPTASPQPEASEPRLPPETIQRVVRLAAPSMRGCAEPGILGRGDLDGRLTVEFLIGADGRVWRAEEEESTLSNRRVRACILGHFFALRFPAVDGQRVTVRYSLLVNDDATTPIALPAAARAAEPPPPGFKENMQSGRRARGVPPGPVPPPRLEPTPSPCSNGDPMCNDL